MGAVGKTVLLGEDDAAQREVLVEVLEFEGFRVLPAATPEEVIASLAHSPDAVLLDLAGISSPEVLRCLDALPRRPRLIVVSADAALARAAKRLGADGFVAKPYDLDHLLGTLRAVLEPGPSASPAP